MFTGRLSGGSRVMSRSRSRIRPPVGSSKPPIIRRVVVLPQPDGPEQREELAGGDVERDVVDGGTSPNRFSRLSRRISGAVRGGRPSGRSLCAGPRADRLRGTRGPPGADGRVLAAQSQRQIARRPTSRLRPCGDARSAPSQPASKALPGSSRSTSHRRVVRGRRRALARLAVDLGPDDALRDGRGRVQQVDAHALVAVEHAGAVVPPREAARRSGRWSGSVSARPHSRRGPAPRARGDTWVPPCALASLQTSSGAGVTL